MNESTPIGIDVCICTFRRDYLSQTLRSVAANAGGGVTFRIIVADNDTEPSARPLVDAFAAEAPFPVVYLHAPEANIALARNACLDAAEADYVVFIDDDEHVAPTWLSQLLAVATTSAADAVLGPVKALYRDDAPGWVREGDFHSTLPAYVNGQIQTGYTCNAMIRQAEPFQSLRFDLGLGRSGGEDTDYFYRLHDLGGVIVFAPDALVYEPVPEERARLGWLARRRLRSGQSHGMRLVRSGKGGPAAFLLASGKCVYCMAMATVNGFAPVRWRRHLLRGMLHAGVLGGLLGVRQPAIYGNGQGQ